MTLSGAISLPASATLNVGATGGVTLSGNVTTGSGSTVSIAGGGNVTLSGGVATGTGSNLSIAGGGTDTVTAPISGGAAIVYSGTGTGSLTFGVDNSYSGSTTINSNSLILNTANGLGNSTGVIVAAGGEWRWSSITPAEPQRRLEQLRRLSAARSR